MTPFLEFLSNKYGIKSDTLCNLLFCLNEVSLYNLTVHQHSGLGVMGSVVFPAETTNMSAMNFHCHDGAHKCYMSLCVCWTQSGPTGAYSS